MNILHLLVDIIDSLYNKKGFDQAIPVVEWLNAHCRSLNTWTTCLASQVSLLEVVKRLS